MFFGGDQESSRRPGTENIISIVGTGAAAQVAARRAPTFGDSVAPLRDEFEQQLIDRIPGCKINGAQSQRIANTTNIAMPFEEADSLLRST